MPPILFGEPGRQEGRGPIMIGSHLDTQPTGGKFDGAFGVLAALEIARTLNEHNITTQAPLEIVNWINEEGCRFQPSSIGAEVFASGLSLEKGLACCDGNAISLENALRDIGYLGDYPADQIQPAAYLEAHIEQGPILEELNIQIGVVQGGMGVNAHQVTLTGVEAKKPTCAGLLG